MTLQQEAAGLVYKIPGEQLEYIVGLMKTMIVSVNPKGDNTIKTDIKRDISKRIGIAKGKIGNTDYFDKHNKEIAKMFEG